MLFFKFWSGSTNGYSLILISILSFYYFFFFGETEKSNSRILDIKTIGLQQSKMNTDVLAWMKSQKLNEIEFPIMVTDVDESFWLVFLVVLVGWLLFVGFFLSF